MTCFHGLLWSVYDEMHCVINIYFCYSRSPELLPEPFDCVGQLSHGPKELLPPVGNLAKSETHPCWFAIAFINLIEDRNEILSMKYFHPPIHELPLAPHLFSTASQQDCHRGGSSRLARNNRDTMCLHPLSKFSKLVEQ